MFHAYLLKTVIVSIIIWRRSIILIQITLKLCTKQCIWSNKLAHFFIVFPFFALNVDYFFKIFYNKTFIPTCFYLVFCFSCCRTLVFAGCIVEIIYYMAFAYIFLFPSFLLFLFFFV